MDDADTEFLKMAAKIRKRFPNLSDQECSKVALDYFALKNQQTYNNFTQTARRDPKGMSKQKFEEKLNLIKSEKMEIESSRKRKPRSGYTSQLLGKETTILIPYTEQQQQRLRELDNLENELRRRYTLGE